MEIVPFHVLSEILETLGYEDPENDGDNFILQYWLRQDVMDKNPELPALVTKDYPTENAGEGLMGWPIDSVLDLVNGLVDNFKNPGEYASQVTAILKKG